MDECNYPDNDRIRGDVVTATDETAVAYEIPTGSANRLLKNLSFNVSGVTRTVDVAIVAAGETYADAVYDIASALSVAAGAPVGLPATVVPKLLLPGDRLYVVASGAGVTMTGVVGKQETQSYGRPRIS